MPQLPQQRDLLASLAPYHSKLVGESYLGRKRSIFECTETQVECILALLVSVCSDCKAVILAKREFYFLYLTVTFLLLLCFLWSIFA